ncbi:MAG TPA: hypothetical protein VE996_14545 [Terriglobales bacterium]|nr:hypothetical protein [Terriglobales bacterium]
MRRVITAAALTIALGAFQAALGGTIPWDGCSGLAWAAAPGELGSAPGGLCAAAGSARPVGLAPRQRGERGALAARPSAFWRQGWPLETEASRRLERPLGLTTHAGAPLGSLAGARHGARAAGIWNQAQDEFDDGTPAAEPKSLSFLALGVALLGGVGWRRRRLAQGRG